jgi:hypothetical protein
MLAGETDRGRSDQLKVTVRSYYADKTELRISKNPIEKPVSKTLVKSR